MGKTKQLLPLDGLPLLAHAVRAAEASTLAEVVVVLGHDATAVAAALPRRRARIVINPRHADGQSTSLQAGLLALGPAIDAAVILLGDQPRVRAEVIDAIIATYARAWAGPDNGQAGGAWEAAAPQSDPLPLATVPHVRPLVIVPTYGGQDGHPVLLQRSLWPEIMAIRGDEGARSVLRAHRAETLRLEVGREGEAPPRDVDTLADYHSLQEEG
jgi:molybdenum cofactor cytidylyltransferase